MKASKRALREGRAERVWLTLELWMVRSRLSPRNFDVEALEEVVSKVRAFRPSKSTSKRCDVARETRRECATPIRPRCSTRPHRDNFGPTSCMSATYWGDGSAKHLLPLSRNRDALRREAAMLQTRKKTGCRVALAATNATGLSAPLGRRLLVQRVKTCEHKGGRETLPIYLAIELPRRLNDSKALEPQRQRLVAEFALDHLRHDEFPRLLLPLLIHVLRWRSRVRSFAHFLLFGSVNRSRPLSALALGSISRYTRLLACTHDVFPPVLSAKSVSRDTPC